MPAAYLTRSKPFATRCLHNVRVARLTVALALALLCCGASGASAPVELDSQVVLGRYMAALSACVPPVNVVFTYSVSQAGLHNIEQTHRIFRSRMRQRDETVAVDGDPVKMKFIRILNRTDKYAIARIAPRVGPYAFIFLGTHKDGRHLDYVYAAEPLARPTFAVTELTVDGATYVPGLIRFTTSTGKIHATGAIAYQKIGPYCVPQLATVSATVGGKPTRERIMWSAYGFPAALPPSTFYAPKPLAVPTLPPF